MLLLDIFDLQLVEPTGVDAHVEVKREQSRDVTATKAMLVEEQGSDTDGKVTTRRRARLQLPVWAREVHSCCGPAGLCRTPPSHRGVHTRHKGAGLYTPIATTYCLRKLPRQWSPQSSVIWSVCPSERTHRQKECQATRREG